MALSFQTRNTNTAGNVNKKENIKKKTSVAVNSRNNLNQVYFFIKWFLIKTKAQLRAVIYNELTLPALIPLLFFNWHVSVLVVCTDGSNLFVISFCPKGSQSAITNYLLYFQALLTVLPLDWCKVALL